MIRVLALNPHSCLTILRVSLLHPRLSFLNCHISARGLCSPLGLHELTTSNFKHLQVNRYLLTWQEDITTLKRLFIINFSPFGFSWHILKSEKKRDCLRHYTCFFTWTYIFHLPQALPTPTPAPTKKRWGKEHKELTHLHAMCPEETSQSQGPCWVKKAHPAWPQEETSPWDNIVGPRTCSLPRQNTCCGHNGPGLNEIFLQIPACRKRTLGATGQYVPLSPGPSRCHSKWTRSAAEQWGIARLLAIPDTQSLHSAFSFLHSRNNSYCC